VLLRGDRLGELGVLVAKSLAEKKSIKTPWCADGEGGAAAKKEETSGGDGEKKKSTTRGKSADPEEGGE
jgi:hypothetical protein